MKKITLLLLLCSAMVFMFSCESKREKEIKEIKTESISKYSYLTSEISHDTRDSIFVKLDTSAIYKEWKQIEKDSVELGLEHLIETIDYYKSERRKIKDSLKAVSIVEFNKTLKKIKTTNNISYLDLKIKTSNFKKGKTWIVDRYSDRYHIMTAERGEKCYSFNVSVSSKSKNPILPLFAFYTIKDGEFIFKKLLNYHFYRWRDFGAYLGNYHDKKNDFAYSEKILFTVGCKMEKSTFNEPLFLLFYKQACFSRSNNEYGSPSVNYLDRICDVKNTLSLEDVELDYEVIKIFNKNKI